MRPNHSTRSPKIFLIAIVLLAGLSTHAVGQGQQVGDSSLHQKRDDLLAGVTTAICYSGFRDGTRFGLICPLAEFAQWRRAVQAQD